MAIKSFNLPDIGDFESVDVIEVLVSEGDEVDVDDTVVTLESDKAAMEIPSPYKGKVTSVNVSVGDKVSEGDVVCEIDVEEEAGEAEEEKAEEAKPEEKPEEKAPAEPEKPAEEPAKAAEKPAPAPAGAGEKPVNAQPAGAEYHASPSVRAFARKLGADLSQVQGSGPKGRITREDVEQFIKSALQGGPGAPAAAGAGIPPIPEVDFSQFGEIEEQDLPRIKKISGKHLHACWLNVPHVTQFDEADITELDAFRKSMKPKAEKEGIKLTPLVFVMKAVVAALKQFPRFNASLSADGEKLIVKKYFNIGIAVDTPNGLVVPVVRDVDQKSIFELSEELMEISQKARDGKLSPKDMSGATFSISSLGGIGGTQFTPIVNAPEVGILGLSKAEMKPVWNGSEFEPRLVMPCSLSYDHRLVDGAAGVRFTTQLSEYLTDIRQMLL
mgnify:CR=1 FL=1